MERAVEHAVVAIPTEGDVTDTKQILCKMEMRFLSKNENLKRVNEHRSAKGKNRGLSQVDIRLMYGYPSNVVASQKHHEATCQTQGKAILTERLTLPEYLTDQSDWLPIEEIEKRTKTLRKQLKHVLIDQSLRQRPLGPKLEVEGWLGTHTAIVAEWNKEQASKSRAFRTKSAAAVTSGRREHENSDSGSPLISTDLAQQLLIDTSWTFPIPTPYDEATAQRLATEAQVLTKEQLAQHCIHRFNEIPRILEDGSVTGTNLDGEEISFKWDDHPHKMVIINTQSIWEKAVQSCTSGPDDREYRTLFSKRLREMEDIPTFRTETSKQVHLNFEFRA